MTTRECDFLIVGGGLGGLAAATRAHDLGMESLILEKTDLIGGVAAYSGGVAWIPNNHLQDGVSYSDSADEAELYLSYVNGIGVSHDARLRRAYVDAAPRAIEYYREDVGIPFEDSRFQDQYYPDAPGSKQHGRILEVAVQGGELGEWAARERLSPHLELVGLTQREVAEIGGDLEARRQLRDLLARRKAEDFRTYGYGLVAGFMKAALVARQTPIELGARAVELLQSDGQITGAVALIGGERTEVRARRGVLIATGSYGNAEWAASAEGLPELYEASPPVLEGDGVTLTDPTPAALVRAGQAFTLLGYLSPGETHPGTDAPFHREVFDCLGFPHSIVVNEDGQRFADESFYGYVVSALRAFDPQRKRWANYPCFFICDDRFRRQYPFGRYAPGDSWPESFAHARRLSDLGRELGIDQHRLTATVDRFNAEAVRGQDPDYGRGTLPYARLRGGDSRYPNPNLGALEEAPFWGVRLNLIGLGIYSMGLSIDIDARALTRTGAPVPGLYATGNAVAYTEQPAYVGGLANGRNITYAYLAANHASGAMRRRPKTPTAA